VGTWPGGRTAAVTAGCLRLRCWNAAAASPCPDLRPIIKAGTGGRKIINCSSGEGAELLSVFGFTRAQLKADLKLKCGKGDVRFAAKSSSPATLPLEEAGSGGQLPPRFTLGTPGDAPRWAGAACRGAGRVGWHSPVISPDTSRLDGFSCQGPFSFAIVCS